MTKKELLDRIKALEKRVLDLENFKVKVLPISESVESFRPIFIETEPTPSTVTCSAEEYNQNVLTNGTRFA